MNISFKRLIFSRGPGTDMLTHLLICEHKTAYASEEEARANTVKSLDDTPSKPVDEPMPVDNVSRIILQNWNAYLQQRAQLQTVYLLKCTTKVNPQLSTN